MSAVEARLSTGDVLRGDGKTLGRVEEYCIEWDGS